MSDPDSDLIALRITRVLQIYQGINLAMIQLQIGSSIPTSIWRPVLDRLVKESVVLVTEEIGISPAGRTQIYKHYTLNKQLG